MPFPLGDLKRSYGRSGVRGAPPDVRPFLLTGANLDRYLPAVEASIIWHEERVARRRVDVDFDSLALLVGDYRLARCLASCLQRCYRFAAGTFLDDTDANRASGLTSSLAVRRIRSASELRMYVFEQVALRHGGALVPEKRRVALDEIAEPLRLNAAALETLLWSDADGEHVLAREGPVPRGIDVAASYNRGALETLLLRTVSAELVLPAPDGEAIRRFYFLMKRCGLLSDLELVDQRTGPTGGVRAHLFGPLEVFGPRTRHGDRFARAILQLLRWLPALSGEARVLINEREYALRLQGTLGQIVEAAPELGSDPPDFAQDDALTDGGAINANQTALVASGTTTERFDSDVEARLFATLRGMEKRDDTHGWHVEREPEPLVQEGVVLVPDFVLARASGQGKDPVRVYVEVIGFWTEAYRQRKRHKLSLLDPRVPLVLAVQDQLESDFQGLPFPILTYKQRVSAVDLIGVLRRKYDNSTERTAAAAATLAALLANCPSTVEVLGQAQLLATLGLTGAGDMSPVLQRCMAPVSGWMWLPGVGLSRDGWVADLVEECGRIVDAAGDDGLALERLGTHLQERPRWSAAAGHLEAILPRIGFEVEWHTLFEAAVRRTGHRFAGQPPKPAD